LAVFYLFPENSQCYAVLHVIARQCLFWRELRTLIDCTLVTCEAIPSLDPDDRLLFEELQRRGLRAAIATWSDLTVDWAAVGLCVLRSTWDYHSRHGEFTRWIDKASRVTNIWNAPGLVHWNADKRYLRDLELVGVPIVPTVWAKRGEAVDLRTLCGEHGLRDVVIKPSRGAAAHDVLLVHRDLASLAKGQVHLEKLLDMQDVLIQPYLDAVTTYGERALIFFQGRYSHAVIKKPFDRILAVRGSSTATVEATADEVELATRAIASVPGEAMYARVDLLRDSHDEARVNEVELIEPGLYFGACPHAVTTFADVLECQLDTARTLDLHPAVGIPR
jgi:hypothetical protein